MAEELVRRQRGIRTLFATHYHELTALEERLPGLRNYNIAIREWKGTTDRKSVGRERV